MDESAGAAAGERIVKTVVLRAPIERVWRAITDHEEFGTWFKAEVDQPFELGRTQTGHITEPGYEFYQWRSTVVAMEEPRLFAFRWPNPADPRAASYDGAPETLVTFELEEVEEGTRLTITESGFEAIEESRRAQAVRQNTQGWDIQAQRIAAHLGA
ncbi:MAG TPA: SRPBCC family protein [Trueperaceae bacterium]